DMAFYGGFLWRAGAPGPAASPNIIRIDPVTHASSVAFTISFNTIGIAWDGTGFWISEFVPNGLIKKFDFAGNPTAQPFHTNFNLTNGGVALDATDSTLWMGTFGRVYHYTRNGTQLGFISIPADQDPGRFVDGLEFEQGPGPLGVEEGSRSSRISLSVL